MRPRVQNASDDLQFLFTSLNNECCAWLGACTSLFKVVQLHWYLYFGNILAMLGWTGNLGNAIWGSALHFCGKPQGQPFSIVEQPACNIKTISCLLLWTALNYCTSFFSESPCHLSLARYNVPYLGANSVEWTGHVQCSLNTELDLAIHNHVAQCRVPGCVCWYTKILEIQYPEHCGWCPCRESSESSNQTTSPKPLRSRLLVLWAKDVKSLFKSLMSDSDSQCRRCPNAAAQHPILAASWSAWAELPAPACNKPMPGIALKTLVLTCRMMSYVHIPQYP